MNEEKDDPPLTNRAAQMADIYADKGQSNLKDAAMEAGFAEATARTSVYKYLDDPRFQARIAERVAQAGVRQEEVIGTLASHMRADMALIMPDNPVVKRAAELGVSHWIRKLTVKEYFDKSKQAVVTETTVELHNSQTAAKQLCAVMGLDVAPQKNPYDLARAAYERLLLDHPAVEKKIVAERVGKVYGVDARLLYE